MAGKVQSDKNLRFWRDCKSLEEVILTSVFDEKKPIKAYKKLLESNVPKASHTSPGSAEIAKVSASYWHAHLNEGHRLPYFSPFDISELNVFANITNCDIVIYRQTGRRDMKIRPLAVVADTRLFSMNHDNPSPKCVHVVISNEGAKKLNALGLSRARIVQMMPNASSRESVVLEKPIDLAKRIKGVLSESELEELGELTFLKLRQSTLVLENFSKIIGKPIRLFAINCTSRFKKKEMEMKPSDVKRVKCQIVEQRSTVGVSGSDGQTVDICLQARTDGSENTFVVDAVLNLESKTCGPRNAGKDRQIPAVEGASLVREAQKESKNKKIKKEKPQIDRDSMMRKMSPQIRRDPCCSMDPEHLCDACTQMEDEFREMKKPPIMSSLFTYNPQKSAGGSFIAEAKSLGLCEIFPWLEDSVFKSDLMSCSAMDLETLNVPVGVGSTSGIKSTLTTPGDVGGGSTVVTRHVPFVIGTTSFMTKHVLKRSADQLVWRLQKEAGKYVEFRVEEKIDVPGQSDVAAMVSEWLKYIEKRRRILTQVRRKMFQPVISMLKQMARKSNNHLKKMEEEDARAAAEEGDQPAPKSKRTPSFAFSIYGKLLKKLQRMCETINIVTYNGAKFDIINILAHIISAANKAEMKVFISRKGTEIRFLKVGKIVFYDLFKLSTEASLQKLGDMLNIGEKTRDGLEKEYSIPYTFFTTMEKLQSTEVPPLTDDSWKGMRNAKAMCTEEEHMRIVQEVGATSWWPVFSRYLKNVSIEL